MKAKSPHCLLLLNALNHNTAHTFVNTLPPSNLAQTKTDFLEYNDWCEINDAISIIGCETPEHESWIRIVCAKNAVIDEKQF